MAKDKVLHSRCYVAGVGGLLLLAGLGLGSMMAGVYWLVIG